MTYWLSLAASLAAVASCAAQVSRPSPVTAGEGVVFSSDRDGTLQLYLLQVDGGQIRRLTRTERDERHPRPSADGTRVVFQSLGGRTSEIHVLDVASGGITVLMREERASEPSFSPDGKEIVFTCLRNGRRSLWVMRSDGSGVRRLSPPDAHDRSGVFSPDGRRIAFVSEVDGDAELFVMSSDGSGRERLTARRGEDTQPAWGPDGKWLAFSASRSSKHDELVRLDLDGGAARPLTAVRGLRAEYMDRNVASWAPSVSADGDRIVFCSLRDGNSELYLMDAAGAGVQRLTSDPAQDLAPAWCSIVLPTGPR